jgi:hypothetical protein
MSWTPDRSPQLPRGYLTEKRRAVGEENQAKIIHRSAVKEACETEILIKISNNIARSIR